MIKLALLGFASENSHVKVDELHSEWLSDTIHQHDVLSFHISMDHADLLQGVKRYGQLQK